MEEVHISDDVTLEFVNSGDVYIRSKMYGDILLEAEEAKTIMKKLEEHFA